MSEFTEILKLKNKIFFLFKKFQNLSCKIQMVIAIIINMIAAVTVKLFIVQFSDMNIKMVRIRDLVITITKIWNR